MIEWIWNTNPNTDAVNDAMIEKIKNTPEVTDKSGPMRHGWDEVRDSIVKP